MPSKGNAEDHLASVADLQGTAHGIVEPAPLWFVISSDECPLMTGHGVRNLHPSRGVRIPDQWPQGSQHILAVDL